MTEPTVLFYFDFVSPYTWLALMQADLFAIEHRCRWDLRPVVYAALLDAHGLIGPVETAAKRRYTLADVARCAVRLGFALSGPPKHPFRSLEALRAFHVFRLEPRALALAAGLSNACWGKGKDLTDLGVIRETVAEVGLDPKDLEDRISSPATKDGLRRMTEEAVERGVFGVPTFEYREELFWGHDRLEHLAARLDGEPAPSKELLESLVDRPRGAERVRDRR